MAAILACAALLLGMAFPLGAVALAVSSLAFVACGFSGERGASRWVVLAFCIAVSVIEAGLLIRELSQRL